MSSREPRDIWMAISSGASCWASRSRSSCCSDTSRLRSSAGDLFTQGGADCLPVTDSDVLGPSEEFRKPMDYFSHSTKARAMLERLAASSPTTLACMHGSAWRGDGAALLRALAGALER